MFFCRITTMQVSEQNKLKQHNMKCVMILAGEQSLGTEWLIPSLICYHVPEDSGRHTMIHSKLPHLTEHNRKTNKHCLVLMKDGHTPWQRKSAVYSCGQDRQGVPSVAAGHSLDVVWDFIGRNCSFPGNLNWGCKGTERERGLTERPYMHAALLSARKDKWYPREGAEATVPPQAFKCYYTLIKFQASRTLEQSRLNSTKTHFCLRC